MEVSPDDYLAQTNEEHLMSEIELFDKRTAVVEQLQALHEEKKKLLAKIETDKEYVAYREECAMTDKVVKEDKLVLEYEKQRRQSMNNHEERLEQLEKKIQTYETAISERSRKYEDEVVKARERYEAELERIRQRFESDCRSTRESIKKIDDKKDEEKKTFDKKMDYYNHAIENASEKAKEKVSLKKPRSIIEYEIRLKAIEKEMAEQTAKKESITKQMDELDEKRNALRNRRKMIWG